MQYIFITQKKSNQPCAWKATGELSILADAILNKNVAVAWLGLEVSLLSVKK